MFKQLLIVSAFTALMSPLFAEASSSDLPFASDTIIMAGDNPISCQLFDYSGKSKPTVINTNYAYKDSLGRVISSHKANGNSAHGNSTGIKCSVHLDSTLQISKMIKDSYSSAPTSLSGTTDTLTATAWNQKGMPTRGELVSLEFSSNIGGYKSKTTTSSITINYDSTALLPTDTVVAWTRIVKPDTLLQIGELEIAGELTTFETINTKSTADTTLFIDTLGRELFFDYYSHAYRMPNRSHRVRICELDSLNNITVQKYENRSAARGRSDTHTYTLVGEEWNEKGMITRGLFTSFDKRAADHNSYTVYDTVMVSLTYDSDGITLLDTTHQMETAVQSSSTGAKNLFSVSMTNSRISIEGTKPNSSISLFNVRGQMVMKTLTNEYGQAQFNLTDHAKGIYFLKNDLINRKIRLQ